MEKGAGKARMLHRFLDTLALWYKCQRTAKTWGREDPRQWLTREAQNFTMTFMSMSRFEQDNYLTRLQVMYSTISFLEDESKAKQDLDPLFFEQEVEPEIVFEF